MLVLWPRPSSAAAAIWYGLYYGILTRDSAEVASDRIALSLGTGRKLSVSVRNCGICGGELGDDGLGPSAGSSGGGSSSKGLGTMQLSCKHLFHTECIRWACRMLPGCQGRVRVAWQSSAAGSCRRRDVVSMLLCPRCGGDQVGPLHAACPCLPLSALFAPCAPTPEAAASTAGAGASSARRTPAPPAGKRCEPRWRERAGGRLGRGRLGRGDFDVATLTVRLRAHHQPRGPHGEGGSAAVSAVPPAICAAA